MLPSLVVWCVAVMRAASDERVITCWLVRRRRREVVKAGRPPKLWATHGVLLQPCKGAVAHARLPLLRLLLHLLVLLLLAVELLPDAAMHEARAGAAAGAGHMAGAGAAIK